MIAAVKNVGLPKAALPKAAIASVWQKDRGGADFMSLCYGVRLHDTGTTMEVMRVGDMDMHRTLPVQSKMRRCLLSDDGTVNYYLAANDSTLKEDGTAAVLDGSDGQVMVEIPKHYSRHYYEDGDYITLISEHKLPGFFEVPLMYRSAYEATVDRTVEATPKLASVVNTTSAFRGGNNDAAYDGTYRSFLGLPATNINLTNFRAYARNRGAAGLNGAGWNCDLYAAQLATYWLFVIEYANLNCQAAFNAQPDANGYKQGGLGPGVTELSLANWYTYNGYYPFIPCGTTNSLGNASGVVDYTINNGAGITYTAHVPSYRGIENPFGHIWSWTDGCKCEIQSEADGGLSKFYVCNDPAKFQDRSYDDYDYRGNLPRSEGYVKRIMAGEYGENMPVEVGGGSTTYFADYFYTNISTSGTAMRGVSFGGRANYGARDGLADATSSNAASIAVAHFGSRLCFIPSTSSLFSLRSRIKHTGEFVLRR